MIGKKKIKLSILGLLFILLGVLSYEFLWGKVFPFTPVIIGFTKYELPHANFYLQKETKYSDFTKIDTLIPKVEDFHKLKFLYKPDIFIFRDSSSFVRHSLVLTRFCTYYNRIFISPWALKEAGAGKISLEIYMRHELSHSLLNQNAGIIHSFGYPEWLKEGIAMFSANQMGTSFYPGKEETYHLIGQGNFMPPEYFKTGKARKVKFGIQNSPVFIYSEFACIVDYLVATYGKEKFLLYMKELLKNSNNDEVFKGVYNIEFSKVIQNFKSEVVENKEPNSNNINNR